MFGFEIGDMEEIENLKKRNMALNANMQFRSKRKDKNFMDAVFERSFLEQKKIRLWSYRHGSGCL